MLNFISTWRRERETIRELARLTDRELADLGIARSDIRSVAAGAPISRDEVTTYDSLASAAPGWAEQNRAALAA
ncbi:MAG: DUF1127 domain-containing protein [Janthinobacterium lividum]